jgi:phospholipase D1/2
VLYHRLKKAIKNKEVFRVYIILPVFPAGDLNNGYTKLIIHFENKTCHRLRDKLSKDFPDVDVDEYINFSALRNLDWLDEKPVTEQIYVHAKMMIVDDRDVIIGSANINDRSMLGSRDSELCVHVRSDPSKLVIGIMNGTAVEVSPFARDLRIEIWRTFLGIKRNAKKRLKDPISNFVYNGIWRRTATNNRNVYNHLEELQFISPLPYNVRKVEDTNVPVKWKTTKKNLNVYQNSKKELRGHLVKYPIDFLNSETIPLTWKIMKDICL